MVKNILIIPTWYRTQKYPNGGNFVLDQARAVNAHCQKYRAFVVYIDSWFNPDPALSLSTEFEYVTNRWLPPRRSKMGSGLWVKSYMNVLHELDTRFDIIHTTGFPAGYLGSLLSKKLTIPLIITEQYSQLMGNEKLKDYRVENAYNTADALIAVSPGLKEKMKSYLITEKDIYVIPNAIDTDKVRLKKSLPTKSNRLKLLTIGYLSKRKRIELQIQMVKSLVEDGYDTTLDIIGGGKERKQLEILVRKLGLNGRITFLGNQEPDQIHNAIHHYDIYISTSYLETFGVAIFEAVAAGVPVVMTKNTSSEYWFDEKFGTVLSKDISSKELAAAIIKIKRNQTQFNPNRMNKSVKDRFDSFRVASEICSVYDSVL